MTSRALGAVYGATIFLSAFLLFQVQPVAGKMILPWFGGTAAVWTTCLVFFQTVLLLGYLYAHWSIRALSPRTQGVLHASLLAVSLLTLPIAPSVGWKPAGGEEPVGRIVGLLTVSLGLPYFMLSTTGPLLQAWFAREGPGRMPYRLFALSNLGSMLALLSYPVVVEPILRTRTQSIVWSIGYAACAVLCAALALRTTARARVVQMESDPLETAPARSDYVQWAALAVCPSLLLLAVTSHLTQDIAPIPFLWVLPLALYLLSFIVCFERPGWYWRVLWVPLLLLTLGGMMYVVYTATTVRVAIAVPLFAVGLLAGCMVCHGELARRKPPVRFLTGYYLTIAVGGALGGLFVALLAPRIFDANHELPYAIVATSIVAGTVMGGDGWSRLGRRAPVLGCLALVVAPLAFHAFDVLAPRFREGEIARRNFYGALRVVTRGTELNEHRLLIHGVVTHGKQFTNQNRRKWATSYYGEESGAGYAIRRSQGAGAQRVGLIGLGAGTLATYSRRGDAYRFYEINPLVVEVARQQFTYLSDAAGTVEIVPGDARLALEREPPQRFDVLLVDAFSGDAIPVHLLTHEAFAQYFRHLAPDGILAVHVSNVHLDLAPIVKLAADHHGKSILHISSEDDTSRAISSSDWILVAADAQIFTARNLAELGSDVTVEGRVRAWTDDYSSLLPILRALQQ